MLNQMKKQEALDILDRVTSQISMTRADHAKCQEALQVLAQEPKETK